MQRGQLLINYQKYQPHYFEVSQNMIHQPVQERRCTDFGCILVFLIITGAFFGIGIYEISEYNGLTPLPPNIADSEGGKLYITKHLPIIGLGIGSAILTSYLYVLLLKMFPRPMVYFMIVLSMGLIAAMALIGLFTANLGLFIGMGVTFLIYALVLFCLRKQIDTGIAMVKVATTFLSEKKTVFLTPIIKLILTFAVGVFYAYSVSAMAAIIDHRNNEVPQGDSSKQAGFITLFVFFWLVFMFVFYYMMTYTISMVCANWYYGIQGYKGTLIHAYKWMARQFGSIVYAAMVVAVVTFARMMVDGQRKNGNNKNIVVALCLCLLSCILKTIEDLLKVLNHYSVIVFSITGEDYIEGAKTTMGLLWKQLGLMSITNIICNFLVLWGLIITIGIPSILSYIMIRASTSDGGEQGAVVGIVAVCSMLISMVVFEIIVQSVSCIFIYYSMDKSFVERGLIQAKRIAEETYTTINRYSTNPYLMDDPNADNDYNKMRS